MARRFLKTLLVAGALLVPAVAAADLIKQIHAIDNVSYFTSSSGILATSPGDPQTSDPTPPSLRGKILHLEMVMDGPETASTTGTRFVGTDDEFPDITINDGGTLLLALDINFIEVSSVNIDFLSTVNFGGLSGSGLSGLTVTGGDLADDFGGLGASASMLMNITILGGDLGHIFDASFSTLGGAVYDVYLDPPASPRPSRPRFSCSAVACWVSRPSAEGGSVTRRG